MNRDELIERMAKGIDLEGYGAPYGNSATPDSTRIATAALALAEPVIRANERRLVLEELGEIIRSDTERSFISGFATHGKVIQWYARELSVATNPVAEPCTDQTLGGFGRERSGA